MLGFKSLSHKATPAAGRPPHSLGRAIWPFVFASLAVLCLPAARADDWPKKIVLHPTPAPRPLLKYRLLPSMAEQRAGNAVVFYGRTKAAHTEFFSNKQLWDAIYAVPSASLADLGKNDSLRLPHDGSIFRNLERAAQCTECDWQYPIQEDGITLLLPDAQEQREFARLLQADIRWRVAHGDFDGALRSLKTGYAMARHTANAPLLVPGLIGSAIVLLMSDCTLELIQQPEAPNLYWALTCLPAPFYDTRQIFEGEMSVLDAAFPQPAASNHPIDDPEYWRRQLADMADIYLEHYCSSEAERAKFKQEMALRLLRGYPVAKSALLQLGWDRQKIETMPVGQVVLLHSAAVYAELRDEALAAMTLPYWEARPYLDRFEEHVWRAAKTWQSPLPIDRVIPAMQAAQMAFIRVDRQIALLRMLEALRLHASDGKNELPQKLDQVKVPLPVDPMTGKPFEYQWRDGQALISGPPAPGMPFQYEVRLATTSTE